MNAQTKFLIAGSATALVLTGTAFTHAASITTSGSDTLISKIATRFNLNKADVQAVFDQNQQVKIAQRQQSETARLDQAVKDGKLTSSQKELIVNKQADLKAKMDALKSEDPSTRNTDVKKLMDDTKAWATSNKIDVKWLHGGRGGLGMGRHINDTQPNPAS